MTRIFEYIKIALMNIKSNKGRSFLTMLGIIIGIASVILIITIGNGVKIFVNNGLNDIVGNQVEFYCDPNTDKEESIAFEQKDFDTMMQEIPHIKAIYGGGFSRGFDISNIRGAFHVNAVCGTPGMYYAKKEKMVAGRYFNKNDYYAGNPVCVIDQKSAKSLFGHENVLGMTIDMVIWGKTIELKVIGVREYIPPEGIMAMIEMMEESYNDSELKQVSIEIPDTAIWSSILGTEYTYTNFVVVSEDSEHQSDVAMQVLEYCEKKYDCKGENHIHVMNYADMTSQANQVLSMLTLFLVLVAAISLVVGGIGVMNIMLVSVTERTREIGIRKALGARTGSILLQFLLESAIISFMGGVIGIALGISTAYGICGIMKVSTKISIASVVGASSFSIAVGLFFGIYPARKAAKLSPIEALRHE